MGEVQVHGFSLGDDDCAVFQVDPRQLKTIWPGVLPHLITGRRYLAEYYALEDIYALVYSGGLQMWVGASDGNIELVGLTEFVVYPRCKVLRFVWLGGSNFLAYRKYAAWIDLYARRNGCTKIIAVGRKGWTRWLRSVGYEPEYVLLTKDVSEIVEH